MVFRANIFEFSNPIVIYYFRINNWNTETIYEISLELTIKTPEQHH